MNCHPFLEPKMDGRPRINASNSDAVTTNCEMLPNVPRGRTDEISVKSSCKKM